MASLLSSSCIEAQGRSFPDLSRDWSSVINAWDVFLYCHLLQKGFAMFAILSPKIFTSTCAAERTSSEKRERRDNSQEATRKRHRSRSRSNSPSRRPSSNRDKDRERLRDRARDRDRGNPRDLERDRAKSGSRERDDNDRDKSRERERDRRRRMKWMSLTFQVCAQVSRDCFRDWVLDNFQCQ